MPRRINKINRDKGERLQDEYLESQWLFRAKVDGPTQGQQQLSLQETVPS